MRRLVLFVGWGVVAMECVAVGWVGRRLGGELWTMGRLAIFGRP